MYVLLEFWQKNHGDPYYEPTIMVHDRHLPTWTPTEPSYKLKNLVLDRIKGSILLALNL